MVFVTRYHEEGKVDDGVDPIQYSSGSRLLVDNETERLAREHAERIKEGDASPQITNHGVTWVVYDAADKVGFYYTESFRQ